MLENKMVIPCTIYREAADEYGDLRLINPIVTTCWFRDTESLDHQLDREAPIGTSMAWLRAGTTVTQGDILYIGSKYYRVTEATLARRLASSQVQFIKCSLKRQEATVS